MESSTRIYDVDTGSFENAPDEPPLLNRHQRRKLVALMKERAREARKIIAARKRLDG